MLHRIAVLAAVSVLLTGWGHRPPDWPYSGPMPDEAVGIPHAKYSPVDGGTNSYRPVEPMPWGDINKQVAPQAKPPGASKPEASKPEAPKTEPPKAETPRSEAPKPDTPKVEPVKPEPPKMDEHSGHEMQ